VRRIGPIIAALALAWSVAIAAGPSEGQARAAADAVGQALTRSDPSLMRPVLPARGKVKLHLVNLGPEQGFFSSRQVEALLSGFLSQGSVESFQAQRVEFDEERSLVHARAKIVDRQGRPVSVELHLAFQPEDGHWVLREIRETP
jgi:hypothetical protein